MLWRGEDIRCNIKNLKLKWKISKSSRGFVLDDNVYALQQVLEKRMSRDLSTHIIHVDLDKGDGILKNSPTTK